MKHRWRGILFVALGGIAVAALLLFQPVPSEERSMAPGEVTFSQPSGFYDEPFYLELDSDGRSIYYTLDSSEPDENSTLYTGPILIQDASANENVYSMITDTSAYYDRELMERNETDVLYPYVLPGFPVDKATVLRAISVDAAGNRSRMAEAVYFVGFQDKQGYDGTYVMSIATDPSNLFDFDTGIYVLGKSFADTVTDGIVENHDESILYWAANFKNRGIEWERPVSIQCFNPNGELVVSGNYGIRIQGNAARNNMPKNLNLYARQQYGSPGFDGKKLFGADCLLDRLVLYYGSNDSMLKDYLVGTLTRDMSFGTREFTPCALFLEGEYWGEFWLSPRYKKDYLSQKYGVEPDNIVEIKQGISGINVEVGQDEDMALYDELKAFLADNDLSQPENYARACEMIDIDSCIDYYAVEIYICNRDWPQNNIALWRARKPAGGQYSDGKWRWLLFDVELGMRMQYVDYDTLLHAADQDAVFAGLIQNRDFANALYKRMLELADTTFAPDAIDAFIEDYKVRMAGLVQKKIERFFSENKDMGVFYGECDSVKEFFHIRRDYIIEYYGSRIDEQP